MRAGGPRWLPGLSRGSGAQAGAARPGTRLAPWPLPSGHSLPSRRPGRAPVRAGFGPSVCQSPLEPPVRTEEPARPPAGRNGGTRGPDPAPRSARGAEPGRSRSHRLGLCPGGTRLRLTFLLKGIN